MTNLKGDQNTMTMGQKIMQLRTERHLSQEQLAERLGTTRQSVSRWELDQALPSLANIVALSRLFSVTTDTLLRDGISTFDPEYDLYSCGVYRSPTAEIVNTVRFAAVYSCSSDKNILSARLYVGFEDQKTLCAICERNMNAARTSFAFVSNTGKTVSDDGTLTGRIGEPFDPAQLRSMQRLESFTVADNSVKQPTVSETGIRRCLESWRMGASYRVKEDAMNFFLCTGKTEYVFNIRTEGKDIYCGASYNIPFDLGMFGGGQFFRVRNWQDNNEPFCRFFCNFNYYPKEIRIPTEKVQLGCMVQTDTGMLWCVKRYTDDEIILQGCGDDEYRYNRNDKADERYQPL